jgi:hypothetical protein
MNALNPPYGPLPNPYTNQFSFEPTNTSAGMFLTLTCYTNTKLNPGFMPGNVSPQFVLDDALPPTLTVAAFDPILASASITNLHVIGTDLSNPANVSAQSVAAGGMSATFPYPRQSNGSSLAAGAYITTVTTDPAIGAQTTNGMEPFYIAHDDTSFPSAFGVAVASPKEVTTVQNWTRGSHNICFPGNEIVSATAGTPLPLVTLLNQGQLAVGSMSHLIPVGTNPTVVLPFNDEPLTIYPNTDGGDEPQNCAPVIEHDYSGAQSALVVNTGSNNVSIVEIGQYRYPAGTVAVGNRPVAAAINSAETFAYVANYQDGTVSEVDLQNLIQTRVLSVMTHPTSVTFDSNGNLWVGGQGSVSEINLSSWSAGATYPVDGTVNGMSYDVAGGLLIQSLLQNGSTTTPSNGTTAKAMVAYSAAPQTSYSTQSTLNISTGVAVGTPQFSGDNAAYSRSSVASLLAFPAQTAITPPIYSSTNGDMTATVTGTNFTVSIVGTGQVLIQGTLPYPARGVALTNNMVYFTMPDSNSLVSLPIVIP